MNIETDTLHLQRVQHHFTVQSEHFIESCSHKLELARARGNQQGISREQIRIEVMKSAQTMLESAFLQARKEQP